MAHPTTAELQGIMIKIKAEQTRFMRLKKERLGYTSNKLK